MSPGSNVAIAVVTTDFAALRISRILRVDLRLRDLMNDMSGVEIKPINIEGGGRRRSLMVHVSRTDDEERRGSLSRETLGQSLRDGTM
jgi:hypothetical protein